MGMMCAVSFTRYGKLYYFDPGPYSPKVGDKVLVPTDAGPEVAECVWAPQWSGDPDPDGVAAGGEAPGEEGAASAARWSSEDSWASGAATTTDRSTDPESDIGGLPVLVGLADQADLERDEESRRRRAEARVAAKRLIREHGLPMKVVAVDHMRSDPGTVRRGGDEGRAESGNRPTPGAGAAYTIYFSAESRVDFRALVRDLARTLSARIELRQLSARDTARVQGGIGPCGRDLCCATFLTDFEPVSVRMAKDQDLPLNPMKISGACGRLMCCLKYEHPLYQEFKAQVPAVGQAVSTPEGDGRVLSHVVPKDEVVVRLNDGGRACACSRASVCAPRNAHDAAYRPTART
ncbi:MAG: PSP1 domain-containing protein, partial [Frankia sp.]